MAKLMIGPDSPCDVKVIPDDKGGVHVVISIPTYNGMLVLQTSVMRDRADGDWVVLLPNVDAYDVHNDVIYLGAPDVERPAKRSRRDR